MHEDRFGWELADVGEAVQAVAPARDEAAAAVLVGEVVCRHKGAGEEGDGVEVKFARREEDDGRADDKTGESGVVEEFGLVGGSGGSRERRGGGVRFLGCGGGHCELWGGRWWMGRCQRTRLRKRACGYDRSIISSRG